MAIAAIACLIVFWNNFNVLARLQLMSFIAILVHQFEEYGFPGGEPSIMNIVMQNSDIPDRYPLNQNSAMVTNVLVTYTVYLIPVFLPNTIWLGLAPMLMGFSQFIVHGIMTNRKMKSFYNPGLGAVIFLHIPVGAYYIYYIVTNGMVSGLDWLFGIVLTLFIAGGVIGGLTYKILASRDSEFVFDKVEMKRFHIKEKMAKRNM